MDSTNEKAEDLMLKYKENFSIEFSLPTVYVHKALFYPKSP